MTIIDRYVLRQFAFVLAVSFISLAGLYVVIDVFSNLDEFEKLQEQGGGLAAILVEYYSVRMLDFFNRTGVLLAMTAGIFALALMQRSGELAALEAGGISKLRVAAPILAATLAVVGVAVVNREAWLPQVRDQLAANAQQRLGTRKDAPRLYFDPASGLGVQGDSISILDRTMGETVVYLPPTYRGESIQVMGPRIRGAAARWASADQQHPAGLIVDQISEPPQIDVVPSLGETAAPLVMTRRDYAWLQPQQCFVAINIDWSQLALGQNAARYASLAELVRASRQPTFFFSSRQRVEVHWRIIRPFVDMTIVLIGLPLVVGRGGRNVFVAAGWCLGLIVAVNLTVFACHGLGAASLIQPPALAAWLPLIFFGPLAWVTVTKLWR